MIVHGPQGCGKSRAAEQLRRKFGCSRVVDEWEPGQALQAGALHLTHVEMVDGQLGAARVVRFDRAS